MGSNLRRGNDIFFLPFFLSFRLQKRVLKHLGIFFLPNDKEKMNSSDFVNCVEFISFHVVLIIIVASSIRSQVLHALQ